jgi:hypothetical protein
MKMTFEFDDQMVFDAVVEQCTRYMIEKRCSGMVGTITKDVAQQVKSEVVDSGLIEKRVEEVVKRVENSLMARVNKQFTPVMDEAVNIAAKQFDVPKKEGPYYKVTGEGRQVRDLMIATLIGFQNDMGNDEFSPEYKAYQRVLEYVEKTFGEMMS